MAKKSVSEARRPSSLQAKRGRRVKEQLRQSWNLGGQEQSPAQPPGARGEGPIRGVRECPHVTMSFPLATGVTLSLRADVRGGVGCSAQSPGGPVGEAICDMPPD